MDLALPTISVVSRTDRAVEVLMELVTSGRFASGDFLPSEPDLSKRLGVSRPTVRQALRTLEARGLVSTRQGVGAQVIDRTREVATDSIGMMLLRSGSGPRDLLEVRRMLECQGAALAAVRATPDDIDVLSAAVDRMRSQSSTVAEYVEGDLDFHLRLAEASKNGVLVPLVHAIRGLLLDTIATTYAVDGRTERRLQDHTGVLEAISARDAAAAEAAMRAHLQSTEDMLRQAGMLEPRVNQEG
jgi:GntR family transcriptional repressor for pyruvate dehydrogenase complex